MSVFDWRSKPSEVVTKIVPMKTSSRPNPHRKFVSDSHDSRLKPVEATLADGTTRWFPSVTSASMDLDLNTSSIAKAAAKNGRHAGMQWKYCGRNPEKKS